ncbi:hypothetical protein GJ699_23065 [Duganella sp. FT80W]|uniref:Uncharacterized protein n=1 Tax=Duganella guangzhouensis TaxID=2666084 RepID=A0A6I2L3H8_9BURK|nr:DUF6624 domain-containing protein [Duganella guangzhouensis]MRW92885.1 hypothetical protein [Duganella guangzhouensis]
MKTWKMLAVATSLLSIAAHSAECDSVTLTKKYAGMLNEDQVLRGRYIQILESEYQKKTTDPQEKERIENSIIESDEKNRIELDHLIARCGWPGRLDEKRAARAAFFIIQHAELPYQLKYFPTIKAANRRGEISNEHLAWLVDRILVRQGKRQKYGTEFEYGSNKIAPIEDIKNLNQRRMKIGLPPMAGF